MSKMLDYYLEDLDRSQEDDIDSLINQNNISLEKNIVETIISLANKTFQDFNREKNLDGEEIMKVLSSAIKSGIIKVS